VSARLDNVLTGEGTHVFSSSVKNSILGRGVKIEEGCSIEDSIIMDFTIVGKGSRIRKTIVDRFNLLEVGTTIGFDLAADAKKYHLDKTCGIVVVKRGSRKAG
jgi:glucose-1-phosphate adenylyltransferase